MLIQKKEPIFDERYSDFSKSFAWSAFAILPAAFIFIYNAFLTLFKHNFTNFSTYLEAYINGLQKYMLIFFGFLFKVMPQLIFQSCKICFSQKITDTIFFKHKNL